MKNTMNQQLFELAFVGFDHHFNPNENGEFIASIECNQKFTLDFVQELLRLMKNTTEIVKELPNINGKGGFGFETIVRNKKFKILIGTKEAFDTMMLNH